MNILCKIFGHKKPSLMPYGEDYMELKCSITDNIGRIHADIYAICPRCKKVYRIGRTYILPKI